MFDKLFCDTAHNGIPRLINDFSSVDPDIMEVLGKETHSIIIAPLKGKNGVFGIIWAAREKAVPSFTEDDLLLLESISGLSAIAIDNIALFEQQRYISDTLQKGFATQTLPLIEKTDVGIFYASATSAAIVGGDLYDAIKLSDSRMALFVGDVSGKGITATSEAAMAKYSLRAFASENPDPVYVLGAFNQVASQQLINGHFITMVYVLYNVMDGSLNLCIAGHPYPLLYSSTSNAITTLIADNPAMSLLPGYSFKSLSAKLNAGDILALYTDGIIELRRDREFFGIERLGKLLVDFADLKAQ
ncbi:MAG: SpoIIE family protein phosphatase, partial [Rubrobacteridae bacterium]|nr:SpoIIE family protein phosphatase [Rubrobacteridae bacterium]